MGEGGQGVSVTHEGGNPILMLIGSWKLKSVVASCWTPEPMERATFEDIVENIERNVSHMAAGEKEEKEGGGGCNVVRMALIGFRVQR